MCDSLYIRMMNICMYDRYDGKSERQQFWYLLLVVRFFLLFPSPPAPLLRLSIFLFMVARTAAMADWSVVVDGDGESCFGLERLLESSSTWALSAWIWASFSAKAAERCPSWRDSWLVMMELTSSSVRATLAIPASLRVSCLL